MMPDAPRTGKQWQCETVVVTSETTARAGARRGRPGYDRDQVLAIAVQLFNEQGYDATSVADLAERLGLTKSALYHHFASKDELLSLALDSALTALEGVLDDAEHRAESDAERLRDVIGGAVEVLIDHLPEVTLLLRVRGNSKTEQQALERRRVFDARVAALVAGAQSEGWIRADVDAAIATRLIFGMINSVVEWYRPGGPIDRDALARGILTVVLDGLRSPAT
jgi:AcrR family transcriptional regulator